MSKIKVCARCNGEESVMFRVPPTRKDRGLFVQAVCGGGESGQPLLPLRGDVERVAADRV